MKVRVGNRMWVEIEEWMKERRGLCEKEERQVENRGGWR